MTVPRLFAIAVIFVGAAVSWFALGASITVRTGENDGRLARDVALLWGGPHLQVAPSGCVERPSTSTETIEEKVMELKDRKSRLFDSVVGDEAELAGALTEDDIRGLLDLGPG